MSAALVESVRRNLCMAPDVREEYGIDLPAILAALTEAEALRAQIAAGQAREVALREALATIKRDVALHASADDSVCECATCHCWDIALLALSAPTDTAALRAFGKRCWHDGYDAVPSVGQSSPENIAQDCADDLDRILGGS